MPSPSGSTPVFGLPYLLETDVPDIATASQQLALAVEAVLESVGTPIGGEIGWWSNTLPSVGTWAFEHGQTITNGATTYPKLAALYPSWVSGSNLIIPDTRNRVPMGAGSTYSPGGTGGSATVTLGSGNIPQMSAGVAISDPGHYHAAQPGYAVIVQTGSAFGLMSGPTGTQAASNVGNPNTDNKGTGISGSVTIGSATPSAVNILNPFIAKHWIVRLA